MNPAVSSAVAMGYTPGHGDHGAETDKNTTFCGPYFSYSISKTGAIFPQWGHEYHMNSNNTTFPLNDERETFCPVNPLGPTTGKVKSGAREVAVVVVGVVVVTVSGRGG